VDPQPPQQPPSGPWGEPNQWPAPEPPTGAEPPQNLLLAVRLMFAGAGLAVLNILIGFTQKDEIRKRLLENDSSLSKDDLDAATNAVMVFSVVVGLIAVGLWIWMARTNGQGKTWARTTATVFGGLNILGFVIGLGMGNQAPLQSVMAAISVVLAAAILYLLYRPDSDQYYRIMSGRTGY